MSQCACVRAPVRELCAVRVSFTFSFLRRCALAIDKYKVTFMQRMSWPPVSCLVLPKAPHEYNSTHEYEYEYT